MYDDPGQCWNYFDSIFCISLEDRVDRRREAVLQFESVGLLDFVEFILVKRDPQNSERGIYESHIRCMQRGLNAGASSILIFEDDIVFDRFSLDTLRECVSFMGSDRNWTFFFFGCLAAKIRKTEIRSVVGVEYGCLTHAYAVRNETARRIVSRKWSGRAYDMMVRDMGGQYYAAFPLFAFQSSSATDNFNHPGLDRLRRLFGGFKRVQKFNEFYNRHKAAVVLMHMLFLFLIIWITGLLR